MACFQTNAQQHNYVLSFDINDESDITCVCSSENCSIFDADKQNLYQKNLRRWALCWQLSNIKHKTPAETQQQLSVFTTENHTKKTVRVTGITLLCVIWNIPNFVCCMGALCEFSHQGESST